MTLAVYLGAWLLDGLFGDPVNWPHPIRWIGWLTSKCEKLARRVCQSRTALYAAGAIVWLVVVSVAGVGCWALLELLGMIHPMLRLVVELWLGFTTLAGRCLRDSAYAVINPLKCGDIETSRVMLSYIVGRDTKALDEPQICRATVETVAENSVDGVIAPLFYLFLGGVPLAMAYKAINTLDSMLGYNNLKYREIGFVSAKVDDLANYLPARFGWLLLSVSACLLKLNTKAAFRVGWRDRYNHKSPNSAWSEATVAGALGVRLGGPNLYFGQMVEKPWIGDEINTIAPKHVELACRLMLTASALALVVFSTVWFVVQSLNGA